MKKRFLSLFFSLVILCCFEHCQSPSPKIKEAFDQVNNSLIKTGRSFSDSLSMLYHTIDSAKVNNQQLAAKADSLYHIVTRAIDYMDSIRQDLGRLDSTGERTDISTKLLVNTPTGDRFYRGLQAVNYYARAAVTDSMKLQFLNAIFLYHRDPPTYPQWIRLHFDGTSTAAARTMITELQNDCKEASLLVLNDIKGRLVDFPGK